MGLTILAPPTQTTQPVPDAARGSSCVAGSEVGANTSVSKHAVVGPYAVAINLPNLFSSKHERATRAQAEIE
jgi:hypothetical protein